MFGFKVLPSVGFASGSKVLGLRIQDFTGDGIALNNVSNVQIGGAGTGQGNVIVANKGNGIHVTGTLAQNNVIDGNFIGTDPGIPNSANEQKVTPPVKAPLEDAARALQFVRSKAGDWNIDKKKIGATGGSAGGCSSLWLAFHDDMANPKSDDPVARESTRLYCAAVDGAQVTLDPKEVRGWLPGYTYGAHAFGMKNLDEVETNRDKIADWIKEYSPITHVTKDDPPIGLYYGTGKSKTADGKERDDFTHSPVLGQKLAEKLKATGIDATYHSAAEPNAKLPSSRAYLIEYLKK